MKLIKNEQIKVESWTQLLDGCDFASPFQTLGFYKFFNSVDGFISDVFAVEEDGEYKALSIVTIQKEKGVRSYFSRRGIIYAGPLVQNDGQEYLEYLLKEITKAYKGKLIYLETRNYFDYSEYQSQFANTGFKYLSWLNFQLSTSDLSGMKKAMSSSRLRQVKKAIKNGAEWKEAGSIEDIKAFYNILSDLYLNKIKKPLFSLDFFIEFYNQNVGKYFLVYYESKVIGGIVCPILPEKSIYEFYVCGLDSEYKDQYPSVMATWAAMEYANQNHLSVFDFMGAGSPDDKYGVREFKSRFGGDEVEYGRFLAILNPLLYKLGVFGLKILSKIRS